MKNATRTPIGTKLAISVIRSRAHAWLMSTDAGQPSALPLLDRARVR